jgi:hypothetical protein
MQIFKEEDTLAQIRCTAESSIVIIPTAQHDQLLNCPKDFKQKTVTETACY